MTFAVAPSLDRVFVGLQAWLMDALGLDGNHVVQGLGNGVPPPKGPYVSMNKQGQRRLGTNVASYQDQPAASPAVETMTLEQSEDLVIAANCYGPSSASWAVIVATVFRSDLAVDFLAPYGVTPLWADDPTPIPLVNGEEQYEERWLVKLHLQFKPGVTAPMQFMNSAQVIPVSVETLS